MSRNPKPTSYAQYRQFAEQVAADTRGDGSSLDALASKNFEVRPAEAHKRIIEVELHKTLLATYCDDYGRGCDLLHQTGTGSLSPPYCMCSSECMYLLFSGGTTNANEHPLTRLCVVFILGSQH